LQKRPRGCSILPPELHRPAIHKETTRQNAKQEKSNASLYFCLKARMFNIYIQIGRKQKNLD